MSTGRTRFSCGHNKNVRVWPTLEMCNSSPRLTIRNFCKTRSSNGEDNAEGRGVRRLRRGGILCPKFRFGWWR
jgi:hypothetical protein